MMKWLLTVQLILLVIASAAATDKVTCCQQKNFKSRCHFLCDESLESSFLDQFACASERIQLLGCKTQEAIDLVKLFGQEFTDTVEKNWESLSAGLKQKLSQTSEFAKITVNELKAIHQDMLSSLATLKEMTSAQFGGLMSRFKDFTTENLSQLLKKVKLDVIYEKFSDLANYSWDKSQLSVLVQAAYEKYGPKVEEWTSENFRKLGKLMAGLPSAAFSKLSNEAFENSLDKICDAGLSFQKKLKLMVPAKNVFGTVSSWNSTTVGRLCNIIESLSPEELLELATEEIEGSLVHLEKLALTPEQKEAIVKKLKTKWGKISSWTIDQVQKMKEFVEGFDLDDIKDLSKQQIQQWLTTGKIKVLNKFQKSTLFQQMVTRYGEPSTWPKTLLEEASDLLDSLSVSDMKKIAKDNLIAALYKAKSVEWSQDQAEYLLEVLESDPAQLTKITKEQIVNLGSLLKAFSKSDVGKLTKRALFLAFPELAFIAGVGEPVLRHFIKVYKEEDGQITNLKEFAKALTRHEIETETINNLLGSLQQLAGIDFDEAQIAEFMNKLRQELGNLNETDHRDDDILPWGFQNLQKMGTIVLGLNRKEAEKFPIKGINNTYEKLGKQDGWKRRLVLAFYKRIKTNWEKQNIKLEDLKEVDMEILGKFVQGFGKDDLNTLSDEVKLIAIQKLGEFTGLPEDKLKTRADFAFKYLKSLHGAIQSSDVKTMGNLLSGLSSELLSQLPPFALVDNIEKLIKGVDVEKFKQIVQKVKSVYKESDISKWTSVQWQKVIPLLAKLPSVDELKEMSPESLDDLLKELGAVKTWTKEQSKVLLDKAKQKWGNDIWKGTKGSVVHRLGSILSALSADDISKLTKEFFENINSDLLNSENLSEEFKKALAQRFSTIYLENDFLKMSAKVLKRFRYFLVGLNIEQLKNIAVDSADKLDALGNVTDWNAEQLSTLAQKAIKYIKDNVDNDAYMSVKNLLKGFTLDDIKTIPDKAFLQAAGKFGKITGLSDEQSSELVKKAKKVWGDVSTWTGARVSEAGNFIGGLELTDINKLNPNEISRIPPSVFGNMNEEKLKEFTVDQLLELDTEQVKVLSDAKISNLPEPKASAIRSVQNEDPIEADPYNTSSDSIYYGFQIHIMTMSVLGACLFIWYN